jgi:hypothetical protein
LVVVPSGGKGQYLVQEICSPFGFPRQIDVAFLNSCRLRREAVVLVALGHYADRTNHRAIAQHKGPDVACCQIGIACDYGGLGYDELSDDNRKAILSTFPRLGMKNELTTCLCGIAKNHPNTTRDSFIADFGLKYVPGYMRPSSVDFLHKSPFAE